MVLPKRKSPRLKGYDYSQNGAYFVTICTHERKCLLSRITTVGEGLCALPRNLIVVLDDSGGRGNPPLQKVIGQLKSYTTDSFGNVLWQRSYHDHIIRDEEDYKKIWDYIDTNVMRWREDCFYHNETEQ